MQVDQPAGQRESDAETAVRAVGRLVALNEEVEDVRQAIFGDANASVAHADVDHPVVTTGRDLDLPAGRGELRGVVQDVGDDLDEPDAIAVNQQGIDWQIAW